MAQPVFDDHPLEEYLRDAGEAPDPMPGITHEFAMDQAPGTHHRARLVVELINMDWVPDFVIQAVELTRNVLSAARTSTSPHTSFGERFKYDIISSSLLSTPLSSCSRPHSLSPTLPGRLSTGHSRVPSRESSPPPFSSARPSSAPCSQGVVAPAPNWPDTTMLAVTLAFIGGGYYFLAAVALGGALCCARIGPLDNPSPGMLASLEGLNDLIAAADHWDAVVQEAISALENEERSSGITSPTFPTTSAIRIALSSSLHTTQTQCDNVRHLLTALTAPSELAQLSEMYAPPSPTQPTFALSPKTIDRPLSHPGSKTPILPLQTMFKDKRSTWNGSYASLASPTMYSLKRRDKRQSNTSKLLEVAPSPNRASVSAPTTPSSTLAPKEGPSIKNSDTPSSRSADAESNFGLAALDLQRKRRSAGLEAFRLSSLSPRMTNTPWSPRFTTPPSLARHQHHPLSLPALRQALQGAWAAKRYACAHLLALRFEEEDVNTDVGEGEGYWEDVRGVMGLLTGTLGDAASRLADALEREQVGQPSRESSPEDAHPQRPDEAGKATVSFAPMPSHLSRFAVHVDVISTALSDAREHLEQCVASLKDTSPPLPLSRPPTQTEPRAPSPQDAPPLQAYERLRRELGLALRECERGRERLLEIVSPPRPLSDAEGDDEEVPGLGHDLASDESDKPESLSLSALLGSPSAYQLDGVDDGEETRFVDDASQLPPPGIEQVFEAETGREAPLARVRPKLSREERIALVKAQREGGLGLGIAAERQQGREMWGPGGEVVQELKDVIWQVGERRRRLNDGETRQRSQDLSPDMGMAL